MSKIDELIKKLGIALPTPPSPVGNYVAHTIVNNLVYIYRDNYPSTVRVS